MSKLTINIISQEETLDSIEADSLTAVTTEGELTILPGHLPLFARLAVGKLTYKTGEKQEDFAITAGFLDVGPSNKITIITDSLSNVRDLNLSKAQEAVELAKARLKEAREAGLNSSELLKVEASLKQALLEERLASRTSKSTL